MTDNQDLRALLLIIVGQLDGAIGLHVSLHDGKEHYWLSGRWVYELLDRYPTGAFPMESSWQLSQLGWPNRM